MPRRQRRTGATWYIASRFLLATVALSLTGFVFIAVSAEPSVQTLQQDIEAVEGELKSAREESQKYSGGAILAVIQMRLQTLETTKAMLKQKQMSFLRFIKLTYTMNGHTVGPASPEMLAKIEDEIKKVNAEIAAKREEMAVYSGGLILAMGQMTIATNQLALAALQLRHLSAKWGIPIYLSEKPVEPGVIGNPKSDRDAL
jgi:hypothetical protein